MPTPRKLSDILRDIFGSNFGKLSDFDFYDLGNNTKPEDFMGNSDYTKTEETGTDEEGNDFTKTTYVSKDGKRRFSRKVINSTNSMKNNPDMKLSNRIYTLEQDLQIAVEKEEFEKAVQIRDEIKKLKEQLKRKV